MSSYARALKPLSSRLLSGFCRVKSPLHPISTQIRYLSAAPRVLVKKYTKEHEWIDVSEDGKTGVIGISKYASDALGSVVYVELPEVPMTVTGGESIGAVESVKSASDINSPVTCNITEVNRLLEESPQTINSGPEDESSAGGWIAKVQIGEDGIKDLQDLMDPQQYREFTEKDEH